MNSPRLLWPKRTNPSRSQRLTLELSPTGFIAAWFFIVAFHIACGSYLICVAATYWFLSTETMLFYVSNYSLTGTKHYQFYGFVFGMVGGMHCVQVLHIILQSIRSRKFTFQSDQPSIIKRALANRAKPKRSSSWHSFSRSGEAFVRFWNTFFSRKGLFGVESEHFTTVFALREVLEASSQTFQAYRASILLPRAGLNNLIVALLITNCWSTAATQFFLHKRPALERVATLIYDGLISFGIMTIVPLMIFVPYVEAFDIPTKLFKNGDFFYDPVAITKLVLENRLIFASSLFDFGTKLIPQLSIILSLVTVSELVAYSELKVIPGAAKETIPSLAVKSAATKPEAGILGPENKYAVNSQSSDQSRRLRALLKWKNVIVIAMFVLWGAIVLILHSMAAYRTSHYQVVGCRAVTRPWFSNGMEPCSSLVYDCHIQGTKSPSPSSFSRMDPTALSTLAIVHCPALVMPPDIQRFSKLIMVHIYNSTISNWDADSSISATAHTRLLSVLIGRTNMAEFPQGLLQSLPATMMSVQFSETNLAKIPEDLYLRWHFLAMVVFEKGILTTLPYEMFFLPTYKLSFAGNRIETIPSLAMIPPGMIIPELLLKDNPLKGLPEQLADPTAFIMSLNVENTSVSTMPEWVKTQTTVVWAYDTPFCGAPMTDPELPYKAICVEHPAAQGSNFPMYLFEELYPFN